MLKMINDLLEAERNYKPFEMNELSFTGLNADTVEYYNKNGDIHSCHDELTLIYLLIKALETHGVNVGEALSHEMTKIDYWDFV